MTERSTMKRLEIAATLILDQLPKQLRDLAIELADLQYHCPRWHLVAGSIMRLSEEGRLASYSTDPGWSTDRLEREPTICAYKPCSKSFEPTRLGQIYCSNECGHLATIGVQNDLKPSSSFDPDNPTPDSLPGPNPSIEEILRQSAEISYEEITR